MLVQLLDDRVRDGLENDFVGVREQLLHEEVQIASLRHAAGFRKRGDRVGVWLERFQNGFVVDARPQDRLRLSVDGARESEGKSIKSSVDEFAALSPLSEVPSVLSEFLRPSPESTPTLARSEL